MNKLVLYNDQNINILKKKYVTRCSIKDFSELKYISQLINNKYDNIDLSNITLNDKNSNNIINFISNKLNKNGSCNIKHDINKNNLDLLLQNNKLKSKYIHNNLITINKI